MDSSPPTTTSDKINDVTMSWWTSAQAQTEVINLSRCTWEEAEKLGDKATKAPVLYTNTCFPHLIEEYPIWEDRLQVIYGLWRKLRLEQKVFYAEKARINRDLFKVPQQGDINSDLAEIEQMLDKMNV
uniref:Uncharacterized protein n=1 Tax=Panagrolaimus superbus TaxID=310955 RepID=A0A914YC17_9BILA